jgi:hypothetical protein
MHRDNASSHRYTEFSSNISTLPVRHQYNHQRMPASAASRGSSPKRDSDAVTNIQSTFYMHAATHQPHPSRIITSHNPPKLTSHGIPNPPKKVCKKYLPSHTQPHSHQPHIPKLLDRKFRHPRFLDPNRKTHQPQKSRTSPSYRTANRTSKAFPVVGTCNKHCR